MGSYLLRQYITMYNDNLAGVLLLGTGYAFDFISTSFDIYMGLFQRMET